MSVVKLPVTRAGRVSLFVLVFCAGLSPATAATIAVPAGGDLQAAINAAQPGDELLLAAAATYTGNFQLPVKAGAAFITIRTDATQLPRPGVRVTPPDAARLAKLNLRMPRPRWPPFRVRTTGE